MVYDPDFSGHDVPPTSKLKPGVHDAAIADAISECEALGGTASKIPVIRGLRKRVRLGLSEAKLAVEDYGLRHDIPALVGRPTSGTNLLVLCSGLFLGFILLTSLVRGGPLFAPRGLTLLAVFAAGWFCANLFRDRRAGG